MFSLHTQSRAQDPTLDDHPHFLKCASDLASVLRHTIFVDQVRVLLSGPLTTIRAIIQGRISLFKKTRNPATSWGTYHWEHCQGICRTHFREACNAIEMSPIPQIGHDYFRQIVGIPQGSILSALLCCFFYGDLEKKFGQFKDDPKSVCVPALWEQLDLNLLIDFTATYWRLSIYHYKPFESQRILRYDAQWCAQHSCPWSTTDWYLGHPEYGCFISKEKTLTNFDYDYEVLNVTGPKQQGIIIIKAVYLINNLHQHSHGVDIWSIWPICRWQQTIQDIMEQASLIVFELSRCLCPT